MKKLVFIFTIILMGCFVLSSCQKNTDSKVGKIPSVNNNPVTAQKSTGPGIIIFKVQLHRTKGYSKRHHAPCGCNYCAGFCDFEWFPIFKTNDATCAFQIEQGSGSTSNDSIGKIYFIAPVDLDSDSVFYIDQNILVHAPNGDFTILQGQYSYVDSTGVLYPDSSDSTDVVNFHAYIDVPVIN